MVIARFKVKNKKVIYKEYGNKDFIKFSIMIGIFLAPTPSFADGKSITQSLQPLIKVLQELAEPVSYGFMIKGFMSIMSGNEHEGKKTIKNAIAGFLGIQFIPKIFAILKNIQL
ncbi:MAG: hypothetical protein FH761_08460 [Firmicutes bacterium]|nr:hypothetical protein [Bacillota bacterium]